MVHILGKLSRRCGLVIGATALCVTFAALPPQAQVQLADEPRYAPSGGLLLPDGLGFRRLQSWIVIHARCRGGGFCAASARAQTAISQRVYQQSRI